MNTNVKIWMLDTAELNHTELFNRLFHTISSYRQKKITSFYFQKDRNLSLGAGLLIKKALRQYGLQETDMHYLLGPNEKPVFAGFPDLHFNISHSEERVICAFSDSPVGCDIEKITTIDLEIARRFFYDTEYDYIIQQKTKEARENAFFRLWTLKESFMKITGLGMALPLDTFRIFFTEKDIQVSQKVDAQPYYFHEYDCESPYKIACCSHSKHFEKRVIVCHADEL